MQACCVSGVLNMLYLAASMLCAAMNASCHTCVNPPAVLELPHKDQVLPPCVHTEAYCVILSCAVLCCAVLCAALLLHQHHEQAGQDCRGSH
jgi:hypothetical protein